jgi:hypothetical protein
VLLLQIIPCGGFQPGDSIMLISTLARKGFATFLDSNATAILLKIRQNGRFANDSSEKAAISRKNTVGGRIAHQARSFSSIQIYPHQTPFL